MGFYLQACLFPNTEATAQKGQWSCHKTHSTSAAKPGLKTLQAVSSLSPAKESRGPELEGV